MSLSPSVLGRLALRAGRDAIEDDVFSLSAAIAYYTIFSLPPLLVFLVTIAGAVFGAQAVVDTLTAQMGGMIGEDGGGAIRSMIENANGVGSGAGGRVVGVVVLLFGASGAFGQLQKALNRAWEVEEVEGGGLMGLVTKRLLSFGMVLTIGFLLLVSLAVSTALAAVGDATASVAGSGAGGFLMNVVNFVVGVGVIAALFAVLFKVLPDAEIAWRDVGVGAVVTSLLFSLGKTGIGLYLGRADPGSAFGAAGSLAVVLVWIYYSALILLYGAEFTQAWAQSQGDGITPDAPTVAGDDADDVHPAALPREPAPYSSGPAPTG